MNEAYLLDCMEGMRKWPDKYFDLAVVDPPYGGGYGRMQRRTARRYSRLGAPPAEPVRWVV